MERRYDVSSVVVLEVYPVVLGVDSSPLNDAETRHGGCRTKVAFLREAVL